MLNKNIYVWGIECPLLKCINSPLISQYFSPLLKHQNINNMLVSILTSWQLHLSTEYIYILYIHTTGALIKL